MLNLKDPSFYSEGFVYKWHSITSMQSILFQLSNEKTLVVLGYIGDCTTPLCGDSDKLGGGFKYFLFSPLFGEDFQFDEHIFQMGWFNHQLVNHYKDPY